MTDQQISLVLVQQRLKGQDHSQILAHLVRFQTDVDLQVLKRLLAQNVVEWGSPKVLGCEKTLMESSEGEIGEEISGVSFEIVVFE